MNIQSVTRQIIQRCTNITTTTTVQLTGPVALHRMRLSSNSQVQYTNISRLNSFLSSSSRSFHASSLIHFSSPSSSSSPPTSPPIDLNDALINSYADRRARPVSLKAMLSMGSRTEYLLTAAQWLHAELPVRLAKRLRDLEDLPFGLSKTSEVKSLMDLYRASLAESIAMKAPQCSSDELAFTEMIKRILIRHQQVVVDLAAGINGGFIRARSSTSGSSTTSSAQRSHHFLLQEFLDRFNSARIGLRMLMAQHVALHNTPASAADGKKMVGCIEIGCNPSSIVSEAINDAANACRYAYGYTCVPVVRIKDVSGGILNFNYVSAHLKFMIFELLKNAMQRRHHV